MYEFHPYITNDGSIGLYSPDFNDIYHSATGALTEAYEKFILPVDIDNLLQKDSIKILDICYGIGYNSKSFLNLIFEKMIKKKSIMQKRNIAQIDTDNIECQKNKKIGILSSSIEQIHANNILPGISIHAVDNDEILTFLSPFIKTGIKNTKNKNIDFNYEKIYRYLNSKSKKKLPKIMNEINFLIFDKICQNSSEILENNEICDILTNRKYASYFDSKMRGIYEFYKNNVGKSKGKRGFFANLHNIYYHHISKGYKRTLKRYLKQDINFTLKNMDAREFIKSNTDSYDLIFLDAFTPSKCPCLWSYEFFKQLFDHLDSEGMLLTYSTSASVRSAMIEAGFSIGYIYNERTGNFTGTVAVKNPQKIIYPLSEFDLGLLKTTAGIFYRDENLTALNEAIIERRKNEVSFSNRMSTSKFKKLFDRRENGEV